MRRARVVGAFAAAAAICPLLLWDAPAQAVRPRMMPEPLGGAGPAPTWPRRRLDKGSLRPNGMGLIELGAWPAEPTGVASVDPERFRVALRETCGRMTRKRSESWTRWVLESAAHFEVDPFTVAAVIHSRGACRTRGRSDSGGVGLSGLQVRTHAGHFDKRRYRYHVLEGGRWTQRTLPMKQHPFYTRSLELSRPSIYFIAGLLKVFEAQCPAIDGAFGSVPHRHAVSHLVWGDRVRGAGEEDRILTARRRLLRTYRGEREPAQGDFRGLALRLPLDGAPRKVTSAWGEPRAGGKRRHLGIDFDSVRGEPVRAVADGEVILAGADVAGHATRSMPLTEAQGIDRKAFGPAGLLVKVRHRGGLVSAYMHLDSYRVAPGQKVKAGDLLGEVGRTGIRESLAHLHFELRHEGQRVDPLPHMGPLAFAPTSTWRGRRLAWEASRKKRRRGRR